MAMEQPMYATPVAVALPATEKDHRHVKEIAFVDGKGAPIDITGGQAPAAGTVTPAAIKGYKANHNSIPRVSDDGTEFYFVMPSSIGNTLLTAGTTTVARNAIGVGTDAIKAEALAAMKGKTNITAIANLAANAELATVVQKVNEIIAALKA